MPVKHIDIGEFRELGLLQEANRLFFHPHGLALEVTTVGPDGWDDPSPTMQARVDAVAASLQGAGISEGHAAAKAVLADMYPAGSRHLSGVWDYRDDPEGIVFGDWPEEWAAKVETVAAMREAHREVRSQMFGGTDVEPVGWKPSPEQIAAWEKQGEAASDPSGA